MRAILPVIEIFEDLKDLKRSSLLDFEFLDFNWNVLHVFAHLRECFDIFRCFLDLRLNNLIRVEYELCLAACALRNQVDEILP